MKRHVIAAIALAAGAAHAEFWDGNRLLQHMNGVPGEQMMALGYVMGAADAVRGVHFCPPSGAITAGQVNDVVKQQLDRNPALRHLTADTLVAASLGSVWPCKREGSGGQGGRGNV